MNASPSTYHLLVGYYKNTSHRDLIIKNKLYYIRSDNRMGALSKENCNILPHYLFLHHFEKYEIYELRQEPPFLVNGAFLRTLGFDSRGEAYLCFRLKSTDNINLNQLTGKNSRPLYNCEKFSPYFTTLEELCPDC